MTKDGISKWRRDTREVSNRRLNVYTCVVCGKLRQGEWRGGVYLHTGGIAKTEQSIVNKSKLIYWTVESCCSFLCWDSHFSARILSRSMQKRNKPSKVRAERIKKATTNQSAQAFKRFVKRNAKGTSCFYCFKNCGSDFEIDHFIPLAKGGFHADWNLRISCRCCNRTKKDQLPFVKPIGKDWRSHNKEIKQTQKKNVNNQDLQRLQDIKAD